MARANMSQRKRTNILAFLFTLLALFHTTLCTPITQLEAVAAAASPTSTSMFWLDYTKSYNPLAPDPTPGPARAVGAVRGDDDVKFGQTTYYTCITRAGNEHCGWHAPILWVGRAAVPRGKVGGGLPDGGGWCCGRSFVMRAPGGERWVT
ncbi:unnamed protein product [Parascedosporium putredinis]|uniref:Uncharacterized protein n=1 Tax=Parascedosporium putredinis TaxID=1442378 RepID=A0A9P1M994_9PEZI|nr:unnamed protein product [Parascedosporium putredinis]CAI7990373.1 unnamed protein product [Parascedosporium putredinis]